MSCTRAATLSGLWTPRAFTAGGGAASNGPASGISPSTSCATRPAQALYDETGDPVLAQMLLRHKDLKTTRGYLPSLDRLEAALEALERGI
jgi:hypothetical protein